MGTRVKNWLSRDTPPPTPPPTYRDAVIAGFLIVAVGVSAVVYAATKQVDSAIAVFLFAVALGRIYSLYRSVAWIWKRGATFRAKWESLTDTERRAVIDETDVGRDLLFSLYRQTGGLFIPFGVRGVVAYRWYARRPAGLQRSLYQQLYRLWKFYFFTVAWTLAIGILTYCDDEPSFTTKIIGAISVIVVMFGSISIGLEAALSYLLLGGWSLSYHQLNVQISQKVTELAAFAGGALSLIMSTAAAVAFVSRSDGGFAAISPEQAVSTQVGRSFYYAITMLTGNGDPGPSGAAAHLVAGTTYAASLLFIVVVISLLFDAISK